MSITGHRDTDYEILKKLTDYELSIVCQVNKIVNIYCQNESFWRNRILEKVEKSRKMTEIARKINTGKSEDMTQIANEEINELKQYLGFKNLRELSNYLSILPENAIYVVFRWYDVVDRVLDTGFKFDREKLPKSIDYDKIIAKLRRDFLRNLTIYEDENKLRLPNIDLPRDTPGYTNLVSQTSKTINNSLYNLLRSLGIRK